MPIGKVGHLPKTLLYTMGRRDGSVTPESPCRRITLRPTPQSPKASQVSVPRMPWKSLVPPIASRSAARSILSVSPSTTETRSMAESSSVVAS